MTIADTRRIADWSLRPYLLSGLLAAAGLAIHLLTDGAQESGVRMALAALVGVAALALAFTLDEDRWQASAIYAAIAGLVMGGLVWRAVGQADDLAAEEFGIWAGIFATGLSLPLFQAGFHRLRWRTSYADTHYHVWTDAISAGGALAFTGLSWLVLLLVSQLLKLVGIPLHELYDEGWFGWMFSGAAFGAGLGVLRNQLKVLGTLQAVVLTIFSLLAVPVAAAVVVFLVALAVSGPGVLWDATDSSTPVLLAIAAGSFVLVNAVIRDDAAGMSANPALRIAARVLALGMLPLTAFAAISMGVRIDQHGLNPERLWGLAAIVVAVAYGVAYFVDSVLGWKAGWAERLRVSNLKLAAGTALYALLLALPLINFGSISTADQVARLKNGAVSVKDFDFDALKWDFGAPGKRALAQLARSDNDRVAALATQAQARTDRPWNRYIDGDARDEFTGEIVVRPDGARLPEDLRSFILAQPYLCTGASVCRVFLEPGGADAIVVNDGCAVPTIPVGERADPDRDCSIGVNALSRRNGEWDEAQRRIAPAEMTPEQKSEALQSERSAIDSGDVTIGPSRERQVYIGGKPVGAPFE